MSGLLKLDISFFFCMQGVTLILRARLTVSKVDGLFPAKISTDESFDAFYSDLTCFMAYLAGKEKMGN